MSPASIALVARRDHALLGISPWNSYYRPRRIEELVAWACREFRSVDVLVPGYEAAYTLMAGGTETLEAVHRARKVGPQLRNPAYRALQRAGVADWQRRVHSWTELANRPAYAALRAAAEEAYVHDPVVRDACRTVARTAVRHAAGGEERADARIELAVRYALAELPLLLDTPAILSVPSSVFVYHRRIELVEPVVDGRSTHLAPAPGQGYAVVTPTGAGSLVGAA
jgi:cyclo(L-tyrosyl-L-tyrosyl) synthase